MVLRKSWVIHYPWFQDFDSSTMEVAKKLIWVHCQTSLSKLASPNRCTGNIHKNRQRENNKGVFFTYARIRGEIDLGKGLSDRSQLKKWKMDISSGQSLDLENTTFGCRICNQTGHLQGTCSLAKKPANKRKGPWTKTKIWQPFEPPFPNNEEEVDLKDLPSGTDWKCHTVWAPPQTIDPN